MPSKRAPGASRPSNSVTVTAISLPWLPSPRIFELALIPTDVRLLPSLAGVLDRPPCLPARRAPLVGNYLSGDNHPPRAQLDRP